MDIEHLSKWIGREERACETVSKRLVQQFSATLDLEVETGCGEPAPLMIHWCLAQNVVQHAMLDMDGHAKRGGFLPPVSLPRRSRITDVTFKQGRSGPLWFVSVDHTFSVDGRTAVSERQDIVYCSDQAGKANLDTPGPAPEGPHTRRVVPSGALLMRYSAVTFNAHCIHYDLDYVRDVQNYFGLIVHGPLQATLLCQYAAALTMATPMRFSFRSLTPVFDRANFTINAKDSADGLQLWTAQVGGPVTMQADATW